MIELFDVTKKYGKYTALDGISLTFKKGVTAVLAPNGEGKTTLIKMLVSSLSPSSGRILWKNNDITADEKKLREYLEKLAYVPQVPSFYPNWNAITFLQYVAAMRNIATGNGKADKSRIMEELSFFGLEDKAKTKMGTFSSGMLKRVFLAGAFLSDAEVYIFDEPTAGLDPIETEKLKQRISKFGEEKTVIISTHIISDVDGLATNVVMLKDKHLITNERIEILKQQTGLTSLSDIFLTYYKQ